VQALYSSATHRTALALASPQNRKTRTTPDVPTRRLQPQLSVDHTPASLSRSRHYGIRRTQQPRDSLKSGRPGDRERARGPQGAEPATDCRCAASGTAVSPRGAFACAMASSRGALRALEDLMQILTYEWTHEADKAIEAGGTIHELELGVGYRTGSSVSAPFM
jgi:hypothetical protein